MSAEILPFPTLNGVDKNFYVSLAQKTDEVRQAQQLRYRVFAEEMGAKLHSDVALHDCDDFDPHCQHLLIREAVNHQLVGCTRILTSDQVIQAGGYYSESEFDLSNIRQLSGRIMEIGRTCVATEYRNGSMMNLLWAGLAQFMVTGQFDYMMGCASIPMSDNYYHEGFNQLQQRYGVAPHLQVTPKVPLLKLDDAEIPAQALEIPSLLKAYLRLGVKICGEPCWDEDFKVADVFILLDIKQQLQARYMKHFVNRAHRSQSVATTAQYA